MHAKNRQIVLLLLLILFILCLFVFRDQLAALWQALSTPIGPGGLFPQTPN